MEIKMKTLPLRALNRVCLNENFKHYHSMCSALFKSLVGIFNAFRMLSYRLQRNHNRMLSSGKKGFFPPTNLIGILYFVSVVPGGFVVVVVVVVVVVFFFFLKAGLVGWLLTCLFL